MDSGLITYLTTIRFGEGAVTGLSQDLDELGVSRALVVTDRGVRQAGLVEQVLDHLESHKIADIFDATPSNPTEEAAAAAVAVYHDSRANGLIAIGGGSSIDLAKAVGIMATHQGPLESYAAILGGVQRITSAVVPLVAVPTTSGTGSEVGRAALITLNDGRKLGFISPHLIPKRAVCDAVLTRGLPPLLSAATGCDAISHCVETYLSPRFNPPAEAIALDGLGRALRNIETVVTAPDNMRARSEMMMAALQGGLTFQKGLGAIHAISHPLGGLTEPVLHHGMLNAVLLPHVLRFNEGAASEKYVSLRNAAGLRDNADLAAHFNDLNKRLGLPRSLSEMGLPRGVIDDIIEGVLADHSAATNPRPLERAGVQELIEAAY